MALGGISLRGHAAPILQKLMQDTGLTVHLAVLEEGEVILIDRIEPQGTPKLATWVGKRMGLHCTALGKALIAYLPTDELDELIQKQGLIRYNENTIASKRILKKACEEIQRLGYAVDDEEEEIGIRCIGAPVHNGAGEVIAAISISGTKGQLEDIPARAIRVVEAANLLTHHISPLTHERHRPILHKFMHNYHADA